MVDRINAKADNQMARVVWQRINNYGLFPKTLAISKTGIYAFRLSKGSSIFGQTAYRVEVVTILGMLDEFCDTYTLNFKSLKSALKHIQHAREHAKIIYKQIERSIQERG